MLRNIRERIRILNFQISIMTVIWMKVVEARIIWIQSLKIALVISGKIMISHRKAMSLQTHRWLPNHHWPPNIKWCLDLSKIHNSKIIRISSLYQTGLQLKWINLKIILMTRRPRKELLHQLPTIWKVMILKREMTIIFFWAIKTLKKKTRLKDHTVRDLVTLRIAMSLH